MRKPGSTSGKQHALSMHRTKGTWADFAGTAKGSSAAMLLAHYKAFLPAKATQLLSKPSTAPVVAPAAASKASLSWPAGPMGDLMPTVPIPAGHKLVQGWCYKNAEGRQILWVFRFDTQDGTDKTYRPYHWDGGWVAGDPAGLLPLFHLDQMALRPEAHLLVTEGEKSALAAEKLFKGLVSITSSHGANSAAKTDWGAVKGRHIIVWPDNEQPGKAYAQPPTFLRRRAA